MGEEIAEVLGKSKGVDSNLFDFFIGESSLTYLLFLNYDG